MESPGLDPSGDPRAPRDAPEVGPAPPEAQALTAAERLRDFETRATVGTGTFGRVHLVQEKAGAAVALDEGEDGGGGGGGGFFALKVLRIRDVIRLRQEQHVHNEKAVLRELRHPFLVRLFWTCHDARCLYLLMEFVPGGELFGYLRSRGRFPPDAAVFYAAEVVSALDFLHARHIVYRDLKPENILLDRDGHIKLTDFGFAKKLDDRTWTLCGTPEYLAPEVIQSKGHGRAVDWWALGVLVFEMLAGFPPFSDEHPLGIYQQILTARIVFPAHVDFTARDLIRKLLVVDRTRRLGNMKHGAEDVRRHRWFRAVDWASVPHRKLKPPIVPRLSGAGDTSNYRDGDRGDHGDGDHGDPGPVSQEELDIFKDF